MKINSQSRKNFDIILILWIQICEKTMLLMIFISKKFCVVKLVHVNLSYIIPQIYMNMAEIWDNVGMFKKYYYICIWYIIYNQYSIITDIFRSLYLFYPFCPLNPYLTSKTQVGMVLAVKPEFFCHPWTFIYTYYIQEKKNTARSHR